MPRSRNRRPESWLSSVRWRATGIAASFLTIAGSASAQAPSTWEEGPEPPAEQPAPPEKPVLPPPPLRARLVLSTRAPPPVVNSGHLRHTVELVPELALAWSHCQDGSRSDDRCSGVRGGASAAFSAFWRVTPYLAWGGSLQLAGFRRDPPERTAVKDAGALGAFLGLLGRAYFLERGSFDPYVQIGLGGGALGTRGRLNGVRFEDTGAGPALQIGGGADFFITKELKLGPSFSYTRVFVDKIRSCTHGGDADDCDDVSKAEGGHLNSLVTLGVRLSILLGPEM